jgi:hypothetical protein
MRARAPAEHAADARRAIEEDLEERADDAGCVADAQRLAHERVREEAVHAREEHAQRGPARRGDERVVQEGRERQGGEAVRGAVARGELPEVVLVCPQRVCNGSDEYIRTVFCAHFTSMRTSSP